jgi:hypothetical protein
MAERTSLILSLSKDASCQSQTPVRRLLPMIAGAALLLAAAAPAAAEEACYRPAELRADAEVKLAIFLEKAAFACSGVLQGPALDAWTEFHVVPEIVAGLARAEQARAPYYQRLYGGADWQLRSAGERVRRIQDRRLARLRRRRRPLPRRHGSAGSTLSPMNSPPSA